LTCPKLSMLTLALALLWVSANTEKLSAQTKVKAATALLNRPENTLLLIFFSAPMRNKETPAQAATRLASHLASFGC
jgi:hypothetical protein